MPRPCVRAGPGACLAIASLLLASSPVGLQAAGDDIAPDAGQRAAPDRSPSIAVGSQGLLLTSEDGSSQLKVHGYFQADVRSYAPNIYGDDTAAFLFRRVRPLVEGTLWNRIDFRFMPDFGESKAQIQEIYVELRLAGANRLRIGKFKEPIGLEVIRSDRELTFAERSMASDLVPLRYLGLQASGDLVADRLTYEIGYFNGSNDGANGTFTGIPAHEAVGRVFARPLATRPGSALSGFGVGVAASSGNQQGTLAGMKTVGQNTFFTYARGATADGIQYRVAPQSYLYKGPIGFMYEYSLSTQAVSRAGAHCHVRNTGTEISGSVVITGEANSINGVKPRNAFEPAKGRFGALELGARTSHVWVDPRVFPMLADPATAAQQAREYGVVANWYVNAYAKIVVNYEHTDLQMANPWVTPLHDEDLLTVRAQLAF